jgi:hypothetical protein
VCPEDVAVGRTRDACAYQSAKRYGYWRRTDEHRTLLPLAPTGCPLGGPRWQLWVNHTLAHVEAARRGATRARLLVCAPMANRALLRDGEVLGGFRALLAEPDTFGLLPLDDLIEQIAAVAGEGSAWVVGLRARYGGI